MTTFNFSAIVQSTTNPALVPGDIITGTITFDPTQVGIAGNYNFKGSNKSHSFIWKGYHNNIQVAADQYNTSGDYNITITYNTTYNGVIGTLMEIKALGINFYTMDLFLFNAGNIGFTGPTLPVSTNINNFALTAGKISI